MSDRSARGIALGVYGLLLALIVAGALLKGTLTQDDLFGIPFIAFSTMGLVVTLNHPRNPVGWVFLFVGFTATVGFFTSSYAFRSLQMENGLPLGWFLEWVSSWAWFPGIGLLITFALLLFPNGSVPSRRWRWVPRYAVVHIAIVTTAMALIPGPMEPFDPILPSNINPFGWEAAGPTLELLEGIFFSLTPLLALTCMASLVVRYRRASYQERHQIKWFAFSGAGLIFIMVFENVVDSVIGDRLGELVFLVGMIFPAVGAGIGILKYRLYDIDLVINRTLVYGALTTILAGTYFGIVVILQGLLANVAAESDIVIAASTLAVAALFRPLRSRVQSFIDHRFYRRKYDAAATLGRFSVRLRDQVDLDALQQELLTVVGTTMQPAHATLWLREEVQN
jgi:hypothetical protein